MKTHYFLIVLLTLNLLSVLIIAQTDSLHPKRPVIPDSAFQDMGVSVSPSSFHLNIKPGNSIIKEIKVKNDTKKQTKFNVGFNDFEMSNLGKPITTSQKDCKYCLSRYISAAPSYFELKPGEEVKIKLTIAIPDSEEAYRALWTIVTIDQVTERAPLDLEPHPNRLSMGVIPSIGFGVYVYQNPPNVKLNKINIEKFQYTEKEGKRFFDLKVKNTGDGISYCTSYVSLTNLNTGEQKKINVKNFTILPQFIRDFKVDLPSNLLPGKYSAVGVVDFGNEEEMIAAQADFEVK
ncbi:MAG TPA: hypothetical protein PKG63_02750 [Bacteroidales bacterium]|jgi:hypothetical protein|nr:DUF916 domain-containing protein [Bacteroidales bacterium]HNV95369.1 hypothetical protein [Bacteroidales bacterium]HOU97522.1 hypothetical protein [Bacteroidales bacterium]